MRVEKHRHYSVLVGGHQTPSGLDVSGHRRGVSRAQVMGKATQRTVEKVLR